MRFEERELNLYEQAVNAIENAVANGKRIDKIYMTQTEFDEFYQLAMSSLPSTETAAFINRKVFFGVQIEIEEQTRKTRKEKQ